MGSGSLTGRTLASFTFYARSRTPWKPTDEGVVEERSANAPLPLDDPNELYWIEEGAADVFSMPQVAPGEPSGARRYLWTVEKDDFLFGFEESEATKAHSLIAVCTPGTRLRRIPMALIEERARTDSGLFVNLVETFVNRLAGAMVMRPELDEVLQKGVPLQLKKGKNAGVLSGEMLWVQHFGGSSRFGGIPELVLGPDDPPIPIAKGMWLEAESKGVNLFGVDTSMCLVSGDAFRGLARVRSLFRAVAGRVAELEHTGEEQRLHRKAVSEQRMRSQSISRLASVLTSTPLEAVVGEDTDPLVRACRLIGELDGIDFKPPPQWETASRVRDPLAALCRASRVRYRRLTLRGEWWKKDCGNILGFIDKTEKPVALVYDRKRGYELVDPSPDDGDEGIDRIERRPLTKEVIETLNWEAYTFYRPLPDEAVDGGGLIRRILEEARGDLRFILWMAFLSGLMTLVVPIATKEMLGKVVPNALTNEVWMLLLALIGVHLGIGLFNLSRAFTLVRLEGKSNASLQAAIVDRMMALPVPFFRENPVGELAQRALSINAARAVVTGAASVTVLAGVSSLLYLILMLWYNWRLSLLALAIMIITLLWVRTFATRAVGVQRKDLAVQGKVSALVFQMISGIAKLRVAAAEGRLFAKWAERFKEQAELAHRAREYQNKIKVYNELLPLLSSFALFWLAGWLVGRGHVLDTATFVAFNTAYGALFASLEQVGDTVVNVMGIRPILERAGPILETVPEVEMSKPDPGPLSGYIEASHLFFRYKEDTPLVLDDVSFVAMPGEYIAMVGPSGSGKSTTLRMLLGFESPNSGVVYYDGQDLGSVDLSGVRSQIGVVLQNSRLISGSVFDNIVGSAPLTMDEAWQAAEMAGLSDDLKDFPMGMHTVVSEGGGNLSGGQQQRLLIARALVRHPRVLFFDEATSALDNRVQEQVSASLDRLNATRIVIAHRLSTIRHADRIYVMDKGKVIQVGSFDELKEQEGMFQDLMKRQTL